jgi:MarR family transcriptional regulator for hemolysin
LFAHERTFAVVPSPGPPIRQPLGRQIAMTAKQTREWIDRVMTEHGASLTTWIVLQHALQAEPPGFSQRELAEGMQIGGPALVRHLDRLEAEGLVRRQPDPHDRRVTRVSITPRGKKKFEQLAVVARELDDDISSVITARERTTLLSALARIEALAAARNAGDATDQRSDTA